MNQPQIEVKTPEYVSLQFQPAGLGSRAAALIIDQTIMGLTNLLLLFLAFFLLSGEPSLFWLSTLPSYLFGIVIVVVFLINWGYFVFLEYYWSGKTVGKSMVGVRVIQQNGHSITLLSSMIRNLLRIIDTLPAAYFIGILMVFFHPQHKRLGDIVAGTIVVHERKKKKSTKSRLDKELERRSITKSSLDISEWEVKQFKEKDWNLLSVYAKRFLSLPPAQRTLRTNQLANIFLSKVDLEVGKLTEEQKEEALLSLYLWLKEEWEYEF